MSDNDTELWVQMPAVNFYRMQAMLILFMVCLIIFGLYLSILLHCPHALKNRNVVNMQSQTDSATIQHTVGKHDNSYDEKNDDKYFV